MSSINQDLSRMFDLLADLLEINGENAFRVRSFRQVSRSLGNWQEDLKKTSDQGRLREIPNVGEGTEKRIQQFIETGGIHELDELLGSMPDGLPYLLEIPGVGPKKIAAMWKELGVEDILQLKQHIESGAMEKLSGFGKKSVEKISEGIRFLEKSGGRVPAGKVLPLAESLLDEVQKFEGVEDAMICGSLRRGVETVKDIDIVCVAADGNRVVEQFTSHSLAKSVSASGQTKGSITISVEGEREIQADLRVVPRESFGSAMQYFTGSKQHNVRLRENASQKGLKLNEWGLYQGERQIAGRSEEEIYEALGVAVVPVELREDTGEFDVDPTLFEKLVRMDQIKGDLHMHTKASDGKCSIEEMAEAARELGHEYINITDHSRSSSIANGLSIDRLKNHIEDIRKVDERIKGIKILAGCECDILSSGELDYPDDVLAECDVVVASIHVAQGQSRDTITRRAINAIENPHVHILGHPTSRLLNRRPPSDIDMEAVIESAARHRTALEVNASWKRLDLKDAHVRLAMDRGAMITINTDSHHTSQLAQMRMGVTTARRGWATAARVINTFTLKQLLKWKSRPS